MHTGTLVHVAKWLARAHTLAVVVISIRGTDSSIYGLGAGCVSHSNDSPYMLFNDSMSTSAGTSNEQAIAEIANSFCQSLRGTLQAFSSPDKVMLFTEFFLRVIYNIDKVIDARYYLSLSSMFCAT